MNVPYSTTSPWIFPDALTDPGDSWLLLAGQIRDILEVRYSSEEYRTDWRIRYRLCSFDESYRRRKLIQAYELEINLRAKQLVDSECSAETFESVKLWVWMNFRLMSLGTSSKEIWLREFDNEPQSQVAALDTLHRDAIAEAFKARQLPRGWEPYFYHIFPIFPIKTASDLHNHASMFLDIIRDCMQSSSCIPEWVEDESLRCLRNARRALRNIGISPPPFLSERCENLYDVERQVEELVATTSTRVESAPAHESPEPTSPSPETCVVPAPLPHDCEVSASHLLDLDTENKTISRKSVCPVESSVSERELKALKLILKNEQHGVTDDAILHSGTKVYARNALRQFKNVLNSKLSIFQLKIENKTWRLVDTSGESDRISQRK